MREQYGWLRCPSFGEFWFCWRFHSVYGQREVLPHCTWCLRWTVCQFVLVSGQMQGEVLPFLRLDEIGVPPPMSLTGTVMPFNFERQILVGNQAYQSVYVSRVLFSQGSVLSVVICCMYRIKGMNRTHFAPVQWRPSSNYFNKCFAVLVYSWLYLSMNVTITDLCDALLVNSLKQQ